MTNPKQDPPPVAHRVPCPVCRKAVYSLAGIHPQCAMSQIEPPKPEGMKRAGPDPIDRIAVETAEAGTGDDPRPIATPVAEIIGVSLRTIRLWIGTGAWPLPRSVRRETLLFKRSDVECWLMTGAWPRGVHFRKRPRCPSGRRAFIHDGHRANHRGDDRMDLHGLRPHGGLV